MIEVSNLTKKYSGKTVVSDLSFTVPDGQVTGFLGPNGSGKSTTMRCMLNLDIPDSGTALFDGKKFQDIDGKAFVAGALLDTTWFIPGQTALGHINGIAANAGLSKEHAQQCLDTVGLSSVSNQRIKTFSLGMKQRLGLATALLGDPQNLILDEPINGLDPEGVHWIREVIRSYASRGKAVFVSSHLLSEMQLTADRLVMIGKGQSLGEFTMEEFLTSSGDSRSSVLNYQLRTTSPVQAKTLLEANGYTVKSYETPDQDEFIVATPQATAQSFTEKQHAEVLAQLLSAHNILVTKLAVQQVGLEERYLEATRDYEEYSSYETSSQTSSQKGAQS